ncbi:MAG: hypothetical protein ABI836_07820 [Gemmatimonadota bacterium]
MAARIFSAVYEMFNEKLESIGEIRNPMHPGLTGLGKGTVYLERPVPVVRTEARIEG